MERDRIVVLGAGGEVPQYLEALELRAEMGGRGFEIVALLDDNPNIQGHVVHGHRVVGPMARAGEWSDVQYLWGVGNPNCPTIRLELFSRLGLPLERYFTLIHPHAFISRRASLAHGVTVLGGCRVTAGTNVGAHAFLGFNSLVEHESSIGPGSIVASGCHIAGRVTIGAGSYLGQASNIKNAIRIGHCSMIGMGAVVVKDVEDGQTVVGNPARVLRSASLPDGFARMLQRVMVPEALLEG